MGLDQNTSQCPVCDVVDPDDSHEHLQVEVLDAPGFWRSLVDDGAFSQERGVRIAWQLILAAPRIVGPWEEAQKGGTVVRRWFELAHGITKRSWLVQVFEFGSPDMAGDTLAFEAPPASDLEKWGVWFFSSEIKGRCDRTFSSREEAQAAADEILRAEGWVLVP